MQKTAKKASILIWSVFLSMMVSVAFISVSTNVTKNLKENKQIKNTLNAQLEKETAINKAINSKDFEDTKLSNDSLLVFDKSNYVTFWLKENQKYLLEVYDNHNMTIIIEDGSSVSYVNTSDTDIKWIVNKAETFESGVWTIEIQNLWWYAKVKVTSENINSILPQYVNYKIIQKIGSKELIKENSRIKTF